MKRHLILMAKAPRIGRVKTRLAKDIGHVKAWAFHRQQVIRTARALKSPRWDCWLSVSPDASALTHRLWPQGWLRARQGEGDLGARLFKPMRELPPGPVVLIGSDIPGITKQMIADAFQALGHADVVFGPAPDGGYWLVGARRRPRLIELFGDVRWSTEHALSDTLKNVPDGAKVAYVNELADVDTAEDL